MEKKTKKRGLHAKLEDFIIEKGACTPGLVAFRKFIKGRPSATLRHFYDHFPMQYTLWVIGSMTGFNNRFCGRYKKMAEATEGRLGIANGSYLPMEAATVKEDWPNYTNVNLTKRQEKIAREEFERAFPFEFAEKIVRKVLQ